MAAKIKHNNFLDSINEVIKNAKERGVVHLYADSKTLQGRTISINKQELLHFGTTGYLGLEQDMRLKEAAINAIYDFGTQFPLSKTYISHPLYATLEERLKQMYNNNIIITKNSTLGHLAVIPTVITEEDAIILDHQVHWSVQNATIALKEKGAPVEMIRHNNMEMLERKIKELRNKVKNIWYMADGVYSMFGDFAPVDDLKNLLNKYSQLHIYFDDVHGMSWKGKNGTGFISSQFDSLNKRILLFTTLSKTFGASGAVLICPNEKFYHKIKNFGGPLTFSAQLEPASVAAAIASADIHLSEEIYQLQNRLQKRIQYLNSLLDNTDLPLIDKNESPVFYIGTGMPATGYNFVKRMMNEGFFVNLGLFPAVPVKNTGVRITVSLHNKLKDIKALVEAMQYHLPVALKETHTSLDRIYKFFRMQPTKLTETPQKQNSLKTFYCNDINEIDKNLWNTYMSETNICDWNGIRFVQSVFRNNKTIENNWQFHFFIVYDQNDNPVAITFFTTSLWKDDLLAPIKISEKLENIRRTKPYHATQWVTAMGSVFTEGKQHYTNQNHPEWQNAWRTIIKRIEDINVQQNVKQTVLRDFLETDTELKNFFHLRGFVQAQMPEACIINKITWKNKEDYVNQLSARSRRHFKKDIDPFIPLLKTEIKESLNQQTLSHCYQLFQNVQTRNLNINTFNYPYKLIEKMNNNNQWEFILLYKKENNSDNRPIAVMFCYKNKNEIYVPSLVGLNYELNKEYNSYRQLLFQTIMRATDLGFKRIDFGVSASFEKKKVGASVQSRIAFVQADDNFEMERIETAF